MDTGYLVRVANNVEYGILKDAVGECTTIVNLSLRLGSIARDAYFSGYHSAAGNLRTGTAPDSSEIETSTSVLYNFSQGLCLHDKLNGEFTYGAA